MSERRPLLHLTAHEALWPPGTPSQQPGRTPIRLFEDQMGSGLDPGHGRVGSPHPEEQLTWLPAEVWGPVRPLGHCTHFIAGDRAVVALNSSRTMVCVRGGGGIGTQGIRVQSISPLPF